MIDKPTESQGGPMVLVHLILSPRGIHKAEVVMPMDEEDEGRKFYAQLKPHLTELDSVIGGLKNSQHG